MLQYIKAGPTWLNRRPRSKVEGQDEDILGDDFESIDSPERSDFQDESLSERDEVDLDKSFDSLPTSSAARTDSGDDPPSRPKERDETTADGDDFATYASQDILQFDWTGFKHGISVKKVVSPDHVHRPSTPDTGNTTRSRPTPTSPSDEPQPTTRSRPTPVSPSDTPPPRTRSRLTPDSPSDAPPPHGFLPITLPHMEDNDTAVNFALAEAWFNRRRETTMHNQRSNSPLLDPRTGGFQQAPHSTLKEPTYQQSQPLNTGTSRTILKGPVDLDSGSYVQNPPAAKAVPIRNPFEYPTVVDSTPYIPAYDADGISVGSRPKSVSSFPSVATEMTPVISNIAIPQEVISQQYPCSTVLSDASTVVFMQSCSSSDQNIQCEVSHLETCVDVENLDEEFDDDGGPTGYCAALPGERNSCKGFLDFHTYNGKLAILLVTILVMAISTMIASATLTAKANRNSAASIEVGPGVAVTENSTTTINSRPSKVPGSGTKAPAGRNPTGRPSKPRPTSDPTSRPTISFNNFVLPQVATIMGPAAGSSFGSALALSQNRKILAVGAPDYLQQKGQVSIFTSSTAKGDKWLTLDVLSGVNPGDTFGNDVAVSGDGSVLAVGASGTNGTVYTYIYNPANDHYVRLGDPIRGSGSFGKSVAVSLDGYRLAVGAPYASSNTTQLNGQVCVYEFKGNAWVQLGQNLVGDDSVDWLGSAVDISADGNMVIASATKNRSKKGYVRAWAWNGTSWSQVGGDMVNDIQPAYSSDLFGRSIALSEANGRPRVAIGIPWKVVDGKRDAGMAVVKELIGGVWVTLGNPIRQTTAVQSTENGNAVDLDGGILTVGMPGYNNQGAVALYRFAGNDWRMQSILVQGTAVGDYFGVSLSAYRDTSTDEFILAVGALMDGSSGPGYVAAYVRQT